MKSEKKYLNFTYNETIDYSNFSQKHETSDEQVLAKIEHFIQNQVKDILLINIHEDKIFLTEKEKNKLPNAIKNYLRYSECRGIKIYVFNLKKLII